MMMSTGSSAPPLHCGTCGSCSCLCSRLCCWLMLDDLLLEAELLVLMPLMLALLALSLAEWAARICCAMVQMASARFDCSSRRLNTGTQQEKQQHSTESRCRQLR